MADSEVSFPSNYAGRQNKHGSLPVKANVKYPKGTMVARDSNGRAARPATGLTIHGVSEGDFDNTATGPAGVAGANDAFNVELTLGVFEFDYDGTAPKADQIVYALDNHTVSLDGSGGEGIAGVCTETGSGGKVMVLIDPAINGALKNGTAQDVQKLSLTIVAADLTDADGAQTIAFGSAFPANAVLLSRHISVTEAFTDGAAGVFTLDVGDTDVDAIVDGAALGTIAELFGISGVRSGGRWGGTTPGATVLGTVNVTTATLGSVTIELFYTVVA
jgi:hypothetical protein